MPENSNLAQEEIVVNDEVNVTLFDIRKFPLTLDSTMCGASIFTKKKMVEKIDPSLVHGFIANNMGISYLSDPRHKDGLAKFFPTELDHMKAYLTRYNEMRDEFDTAFILPKHGWGRVQPVNNLSLCIMHRPTRHALLKDKQVDIDQVNSHTEIILNFCKMYGWPCIAIEEYNSDSKDHRMKLAQHHDCSYEAAKNLPIRLNMGGSYDTWMTDWNIKKGQKMKLFVDYEHELSTVRDEVFEANRKTILADLLRLDKKRATMWADVPGQPKIALKTLKEQKRTVMSLFCCTIERLIQECCITYLISTKGMILERTMPAQDGYGILPGVWYDGLLKDTSDAVFDKYGLRCTFINKPFDEAIDIPRGVAGAGPFFVMAAEFEKTHCKIVDSSMFVKKVEDYERLETDIVMFTESKLDISYKDKCFLEINPKSLQPMKVNFIKTWLNNNPAQLKFNSLAVYPPGTVCPPAAFNLWTKFAMEMLVIYEPNEAGCKLIRDHIRILCNNDEAVFNYIELWIAHLLQRPNEKSTTPVMIGKPGSGKGSFVKFLTLMMGSSKVFETAEPSIYVWGNFNPLMASCYLVNLNELSKKEFNGCENRFKALQTDASITINGKNINPFKTTSYHKWLITSNNDNCVDASNGQRRNTVIRGSDEKCGDKAYFTDLNRQLSDRNVIKTCFEYYRGLDISDFLSMPMPDTEHQKDLQLLSRSHVESWLEWFTIKHIDDKEPTIIMSGADALVSFREWCSEMKVEYNTTDVKLGVAINMLKIPGISVGQRSNSNRNKNYDIPDLKRHFNVRSDADITNTLFAEETAPAIGKRTHDEDANDRQYLSKEARK